MVSFPLPVKAVVIDLDGTLVDSVKDLAVATNMMLERLGRAPLDESLVRSFIGKGLSRLVQRALTGSLEGEPDSGLFAKALPVFQQCYDSVNGDYTHVYPGVREGLDALAAARIPLGCVTNKAARFVPPLLAKVRIDHYFDLVVCGDTLPRSKPDPLPLTHAAAHFGAVPREVLMIGDSMNDTVAARAAGCPVFCVPYGYSEGVDVRRLDVDAIVNTLLEATRLIKKS
jgi:phosphoglycolate phosphatase